MRSNHAAVVGVAILAAMTLLVAAFPVALQEIRTAPEASGSGSITRTLEASRLLNAGMEDALVSEVLILLVCAAGCGLLVAGLEAFDLWRDSRDEEAARLHTRIAKVLQRDGLMGHLAVTPIVHLPLWRGSQATVELRGRVPTVWLRYAVLRAAEREAAASAAPCHILDRITIVPSMEPLAL